MGGDAVCCRRPPSDAPPGPGDRASLSRLQRPNRTDRETSFDFPGQTLGPGGLLARRQGAAPLLRPRFIHAEPQLRRRGERLALLSEPPGKAGPGRVAGEPAWEAGVRLSTEQIARPAGPHLCGRRKLGGGTSIWEHVACRRTGGTEQYRVRWNLPPGWRVVRGEDRATAPARGEASARVTIVVTGRREVRRPGVARVERGVGPRVRRRPVNSSLSATPAASLDG